MRPPTSKGTDQRELSLFTSRSPSSTSQSTSDSPPRKRSCASAITSNGPDSDQETAGWSEAERPRPFEELAVLGGEARCDARRHADERAADVLITVDAGEPADKRCEPHAREEKPLTALEAPGPGTR